MAGASNPTVDMAVTTAHEDIAPPPEGFDPVNNPADAARLEEYSLPPRPDEHLQPELHDHWREMLSPPMSFVGAQSKRPAVFSPPGSSVGAQSKRLELAAFLTRHDPKFTGRFGSRMQNSRNWSGAYLTRNGGKPFTRVAGRWTVPSVKAGVRSDGETTLKFKSSIWIGIDGKKRWTNSMPQVGTAQELDSDDETQIHHFWWQWWQRGQATVNTLPWRMCGLPLSAGDVVLCNLMVMDPQTALVHAVNRTRNRFATVKLTSDAKLECSTAQWVVERPGEWMNPVPETLCPLPDYGEVIIDKCVGISALDQAAPAFAPRLIRLKATFPDPTRSAVISSPSIRNESARTVRMTYRRP